MRLEKTTIDILHATKRLSVEWNAEHKLFRRHTSSQIILNSEIGAEFRPICVAGMRRRRGGAIQRRVQSGDRAPTPGEVVSHQVDEIDQLPHFVELDALAVF